MNVLSKNKFSYSVHGTPRYKQVLLSSNSCNMAILCQAFFGYCIVDLNFFLVYTQFSRMLLRPKKLICIAAVRM
ncbi:hypothetical protein BRARA_F02438 [Brassica rapa]|uniref:Uncharacterized protein n=1 Tax=Brassica campestris TaxID=3711 RepID=A0A397ZAF1_BRACM|nr:hypothetical protein BRARA_F02438 [Brassica rapa]